MRQPANPVGQSDRGLAVSALVGGRKGLRGRKKEERKKKRRGNRTMKLSGVAKLFQYFIAATCHQGRGGRGTCEKIRERRESGARR